MTFLKLIRANNWIKNFFILLPLFFSANIFNYQILKLNLIIILCFSFITSSVYIVNDILDLEYDKRHPEKKNRPIPSGKYKIKQALLIGLLLFLTGILPIYLISIEAFFITLSYFIINIIYSFKLKQVPIIEMVIVSLGFVLRLIIGGVISKVALTHWIILMVFLLSLFIIISKRRDDVYHYDINKIVNRKVVLQYSLPFIDKLITIISSILLVSYLLFITSDEVINRYDIEYLSLTFLPVLIGVFRYNQLTYVFKKNSSPIKTLFNDVFLQIVLLIWFILFFIIIY